MSAKTPRHPWLSCCSLLAVGAGVVAGAIAAPPETAAGAAFACQAILAAAGIGGNIAASKLEKLAERLKGDDDPLKNKHLITAVGTALRLFFTVRLRQEFPGDAANLDKLGEAAPRVWARISAEALPEYAAASERQLPLILLAAREGEAVFSEEAWKSLADAILAEAGLGDLPNAAAIRNHMARQLPRWFVHDFKQVLKADAETSGQQMAAFQLYATEELLAGQKATLRALQEIRQASGVEQQELLLHIGITRERLESELVRLEEDVRRLERTLDELRAGLGRIEEGVTGANAKLDEVLLQQRRDSECLASIERLLVASSGKDARIASLESFLGVTRAALESFFVSMGEANVPEDKWAEKLADFAKRFRELTVIAGDSNHEEQRRKAVAAIKAGDFLEADRIYSEIEEAELGAAASANKSAAVTRSQRGDLAMLRFAYKEAGAHYAAAAELVKASDEAAHRRYRDQWLDAARRQGREKGDNDALRAVIEEYGRKLAGIERIAVPLDWAMTQNNLGSALLSLGERESGTARLEEAAAAYRAALEERTRERVPLGWARTQNNLGSALSALGERESGTARLEEAVAACRAGLEERTRERVPLEWAMTQNNLGNALSTLGERESGTARLEEAAAAYRAALEEYTRERVPLDWAMTQNNLGSALLSLGERESGTARLEEAAAAYRSALEERTRERVPL
ncbi:tetratricopeptide repeat protein, partial [Candidatus Poribacteria bacterium]|nr:tetratricopeptide repeat protein [Candidatus Poribacteria bacterium]